MKPTPNPTLNERTLADLVVRLVLFALLAILCWRIVTPFVGLITWALVLAVALYPLQQLLAR
jgi:predicted PurR-regulated permease PerM